MKKLRLWVIAAIAVFLAACGGTDAEENCSGTNIGENGNGVRQDAIDWGNYPIIINGVGFEYDFYTAQGYDFPTHVPFGVIWHLGLDEMSAGSQISIQRNGVSVAALNVLNYLASGDDVVAVGANDTFMAAERGFAVYVPISLFRELGFNAYFSGGHVFIYEGESDMQ